MNLLSSKTLNNCNENTINNDLFWNKKIIWLFLLAVYLCLTELNLIQAGDAVGKAVSYLMGLL